MEVRSMTLAWDLETSDGEGREKSFAIGVGVEGVDVDFVCQCEDGFFELVDFVDIGQADDTIVNFANIMGLGEDTHTTPSQFSDLALSFAESAADLFLVIPGSREKDVILQLTRPSIKSGNLPIQYIVFNELRDNCDAICRLGDNHKVMNRIAKCC